MEDLLWKKDQLVVPQPQLYMEMSKPNENLPTLRETPHTPLHPSKTKFVPKDHLHPPIQDRELQLNLLQVKKYKILDSLR